MLAASAVFSLSNVAHASAGRDDAIGSDQPVPQTRVEQAISAVTKSPDPERKAVFVALLSEAANAAERRLETLEGLIDQLEAFMPERPDSAWLASIYGSSSPEEYAETWTEPLPAPLDNLSRDEILVLLQAHDRLHPSAKSERLLAYIVKSLPDAFDTDLIYFPYAEWSLEELANEIVKRRSLLEHGGHEALRSYERQIAERIAADPHSPLWARQWAAPVLFPDDPAKRRELLDSWIPPQ
jgi:hypothetical protein